MPPGAVPEAGETVSQLGLLEAVHVSVLPPPLFTVTVCAVGFVPLDVPLKLNAVPPRASDAGTIGCEEDEATWIAFRMPLRTTPFTSICRMPLVTVAGNCWDNGVSGATEARMSKLLSTVLPLMATLKTRSPRLEY